MPETDVCVTGASGFIGSHLSALLPHALRIDRVAPRNGAGPFIQGDLRDLELLRSLGRSGGRLVHLAAEAEVVVPWSEIPGLVSSNLEGTWNALEALSPRLCVFASSSSVYGTAGSRATAPRWTRCRPLGLYAVSKSAGELLLREWAAGSGGAAVMFRFGNVIGPRCRGLLQYLASHARLHPDGEVPAQLRGGGCLVRDYIPVGFVVRVLAAALERRWKPGSATLFNIGTGRGMTNREVAETARAVIEREGFRLRICYDNPVPAAEAREVVLNCASLERRFGLPLPTADEVRASIQEGVLSLLRS